jgi:hypothetical protein
MRPRSGTSLAKALLLASMAAASFPSAFASARLGAALGFGGLTPPGKWVPLRIRCDEAPESATIQVLRQAEGDREIGRESFPAREALEIECPVWTDRELRTIVVRLSSGGAALAEVKLDARARPFPGHLVLACGLSARSRLAIASCLMPAEPVQAVEIDAAALPANGLDYDGVSALAIADADVALAPAQREALLTWMAAGGRLVLVSARPDNGGLLGSLGLEGAVAFGLGSLARITREPAGTSAKEAAAWRESLALAPYDASARTGAGPAARVSATVGRPSAAAKKARFVIVAMVLAWLGATLAAAAFGRARAAPLAMAAAVGLAAVLAGSPALEAAFMRGASVRALALVLPDSGSAIVTLSAKAYAPSDALGWTDVRALRPLSVAYGGAEKGVMGEWRHGSPRAAFSLRLAQARELDLEAALGPRSLAGSALPSFARGAYPRGGARPPDIESALPLAFLASGDDDSWWEKDPGGAWQKSKGPPPWIEDDAEWIRSVRGGRRALAVLAGSCDAASLGLSVAGGPVREMSWALPLPGGED